MNAIDDVECDSFKNYEGMNAVVKRMGIYRNAMDEMIYTELVVSKLLRSYSILSSRFTITKLVLLRYRSQNKEGRPRARGPISSLTRPKR